MVLGSAVLVYLLLSVHTALFRFALHVIYVSRVILITDKRETVGRKCKVKLFLCVIKHYAMNGYE